jgi:malate synthase
MKVNDVPARADAVLTDDALAFVEALHRRFNPERERLLARRQERQREFDAGILPSFLDHAGETTGVGSADWRAPPTPADLQRRWVEITGPVERKMMINALNSGADCFMADFEDSLSPTWANVTEGQANLMDAVRRTISFDNPDGKAYRLNPVTATLLVRPRGWHLPERHAQVDGLPVSASLFDFGLFFLHNVQALLERGTGPYFYLPKMESHLEARLWREVFAFAEQQLRIRPGTIRATVLIETLPAAFEMEEILYELGPYASGLNAGRWDYLFSFIKKLRTSDDLILPDRAQLTMTVPFMRAYTELLVKTCHRRGAHAMGGMAPFIPNRKDPGVNESALSRVREDKTREVTDGFDGTWVAHPDLVPIARAVFEAALGDRPHQKERLREDVHVAEADLLNVHIGGTVTEAGVRNNINVGLQYLNSWLRGNGAAAIFNLMEDVATAEIARSQLWQWIQKGARLGGDGRSMTSELYQTLKGEEIAKLGDILKEHGPQATQLLDDLVLNPTFVEFLTIPAYRYLD